MSFLGVAAYRRCISHHNIIRRAFSTTPQLQLASSKKNEPNDKWNYNKGSFSEKPEEEVKEYELVTANDLEKQTTPPRGVKMLARDFVEDSLYNPYYGYFARQATIFDTHDTYFNFPSLRDSAEFQEEVAKKYTAYGVDKPDGPGRQLWHTPTELFKVVYQLSRCFVVSLPSSAVVRTSNSSLPRV
jgi:hypothetical protein